MIKRFFILCMCTVLVMICFPDFGRSGWAFAGAFVLVWTGVILIMSVVDNIFGLYRYGGINPFLTFMLFIGVVISALFYLPQEDKVSPINKLKHGQIPTGADFQRGLKKFTFDFHFERRNPRRSENFINQREPEPTTGKTAATSQKKKTVKR